MAWIKMRTDLADDPRVVTLVSRLKRDQLSVLGALYVFWSWADRYTADGNLRAVPVIWLDNYVGIEGFSDAMEGVDWLTIKESQVIGVPRFEEHNGQSAKKRAMASRRQSRSRSKPVTLVSRSKRDQIRGDKKKKSAAHSGDDAAKARRPDPIWDEVVRLFRLATVTKPECSRVGKIVRDLKAHNATPQQIRGAFSRYKHTWPNAACTPEALMKHWGAMVGCSDPDRATVTLHEQTQDRAHANREHDEKVRLEELEMAERGEARPTWSDVKGTLKPGENQP